MLVYGDRARTEGTRDVLLALAALRAELERAGSGLACHALAVEGLILAGQLAQGLADAEMEQAGVDRLTPLQRRSMEVVQAFARAVAASWRSGFDVSAPPTRAEIAALAALPAPDSVRMKACEGYDFYAVYPEAYLEAAERSGLGGEARVIGLRSIGTSLGAMVAAALGAETALSLRPVGHPFQRTLALDGSLRRRLVSGRCHVVVDEGPGLSGSSFGSVADELEAGGAGHDAIAFFPSHGGDLGPKASERHRARWASARRHPADFERTILPRLAGWAEPLTGAATAPLEDLSGGRWAATGEAPAWPGQERRKYRLTSERGVFLLKFAGLGATGAAKLKLAGALHGRGFTPEPVGLAHGFLVERWTERSAPVEAFPRERLIERLGAYLGFRAGLPAGSEAGADLFALQEMTRHNLKEAGLPPPPAGDWARLEPRVRRVLTDGRLHAWEWLVDPAGRLIKTDALDHHRAHDLVGAQDIGWDVAGAEVEFGLSAAESARLVEIVRQESGRAVDAELLQAMRFAYAAFQIGWWRMAADSQGGEDRARAEAQVRRYASTLVSSRP